tara:strand:- start:300 stop:1124 length:825 start_codon:yes stop_codon:yes gene_type:complete
MALASQITRITTVADSSGSLNGKYFFINGVTADSTKDVGFKITEYYVWIDVSSGGSDPSISGKTGIEVDISTNDSDATVATAVKNALDSLDDFTAVISGFVGVTNSNKGAVTEASDFNTGFTITTTTSGVGLLSSNLKFPEDTSLYFIRGDHLGLISSYDSDGSSRTDRKAYQAVDHNIVNGLLIHYYGNPNKVTAITDTPDVDNLYHSAIVDYVKKCLYMDRAGKTSDGNRAQMAMNLMMRHERKFDMAIKKYGTKKRSKTGGTRAVVPASFT